MFTIEEMKDHERGLYEGNEKYNELKQIFKTKRANYKNINVEYSLNGPADFVKKLKSKYPDEELYNYSLFHIIAGSTLYADSYIIDDDLPGGEFEKFIREEF